MMGHLITIVKTFSIVIGISLFSANFNDSLAGELYNQDIPLKGKILQFSDTYGTISYESKIIHYKTQDNASIEATLLLPKIQNPKPGIIFIHMWARDRKTTWGFLEFLASHGYPAIYMDLRGHGNSKFPNSNKRITTKNTEPVYRDFYLDILPAIDILNEQKEVKKDNLIMMGASLGAPLGVIAMKEKKDQFIGMIHLAPALGYFDVNCRKALKSIPYMPTYLISDKHDSSIQSAQKFLTMMKGQKTFFLTNGLGHGTDLFYHDLKIPTLILSWVKQLERVAPILERFQKGKNPKETAISVSQKK